VAKEQIRQIESSQARGRSDFLPPPTLLSEILSRYVSHIRVIKTPKRAQTDCYYLCDAFGLLCPALQITKRKPSAKLKKWSGNIGLDKGVKDPVTAV